MKEVKVENDELWSMKLLKTSLKALKALLWPLRVLDSFLMRRRVRPDGTKGIAPADALFAFLFAGIVFSLVFDILKGVSPIDVFGKFVGLAGNAGTYLAILWLLNDHSLFSELGANGFRCVLKCMLYISLFAYVDLFILFK